MDDVVEETDSIDYNNFIRACFGSGELPDEDDEEFDPSLNDDDEDDEEIDEQFVSVTNDEVGQLRNETIDFLGHAQDHPYVQESVNQASKFLLACQISKQIQLLKSIHAHASMLGEDGLQLCRRSEICLLQFGKQQIYDFGVNYSNEYEFEDLDDSNDCNNNHQGSHVTRSHTIQSSILDTSDIPLRRWTCIESKSDNKNNTPLRQQEEEEESLEILAIHGINEMSTYTTRVIDPISWLHANITPHISLHLTASLLTTISMKSSARASSTAGRSMSYWSEQEDCSLIRAVADCGKVWTRIRQMYFPDRKTRQLRERYGRLMRGKNDYEVVDIG